MFKKPVKIMLNSRRQMMLIKHLVETLIDKLRSMELFSIWNSFVHVLSFVL